MQFTAQEYYASSCERIKQANYLYDEGKSFVLAVYCAGVAIECLLRAFRWQYDQTFEGRHDLMQLVKSAKILRIKEDLMRKKNIPDEEICSQVAEFRNNMNTIATIWKNNLRYASEAKFKTELHKLNQLSGIKGDAVKEKTRQFVQAAQSIHSKGMILWESQKK